MRRSFRAVQPALAGILGMLALLTTIRADATDVVLKDGRVLHGRVGETASLAEQGAGSEGDTIKQIIFVNDDFRMIFVSRRQVQELKPDSSLDVEKFDCEQPRSRVGRNNRMKVAAVGPPAGPMKDFDEYGRRTYPMRTAGGILNVVQVITEITPQYARVEALNLTWDMRIATSTLSDEMLEKLLMHQVNPKNLEQRKKVVRFFLQCKRYGKAVEALQKVIEDFKDDTKVAQELQPTLDKLQIMYSQQLLEELGLRRQCGQHALVQRILNQFKKLPADYLTGEMLQSIRQVQQQYEDFDKQRKTIESDLGKLLGQIDSRADREELAPALADIEAALDADALPRMAAFRQNQNDPQLKPEEKLSLAVGGWLLGADTATPSLPLMLSAWRMQRQVGEYLTEPVKVKRDRQLSSILKEAAARPEILAAMAAHMRPPYPLPEPADEKLPGYFKEEVGVISGQPDVTYYVQLPPEYNPLRRYPMIVSLHAVGMDPELQINWWAGDPSTDRPGRQGQAGRYGYIVIAPAWTTENQKQYEYTPREHAAVLGCVRDACRRFAVDTDRVFLTGHSSGGDAAWDIGVSHPDLWAGVVLVSAEARNACNFYTENARHLPIYVVLGELDGGRITRNAMVLDRYLRNGFNTTVVEYLGRGHEHFVDEQAPLLDWMGRCKRSFPLPGDREFACATVRPTDDRFWWAQIDNLPLNSTVTSWPAPRGIKPLQVHGNVPVNNSVVLTCGNSGATIWLSPEMVNFNARINISVGGRRPSGVQSMIKPSVETMLEDLRVRGDRQHPFWAKVGPAKVEAK